jgi:hypothetical protein
MIRTGRWPRVGALTLVGASCLGTDQRLRRSLGTCDPLHKERQCRAHARP